jgi:hypothetical protein
MPFTLLVIALAVAVGYARGGRLHRLADSGLGWNWLLVVGFGLQGLVNVAAARWGLPDAPGTALLVASHLLVLGWIVLNRYRPGMVLIFVGLALNAVVITANGGMPVDPDAIDAAGLPAVEELEGKHTLMDEDTRLPYLADIIPVRPLRTIISVGDIVLAAGLIPLVSALMTYRPPAERRGGPRGDRGRRSQRSERST